MCQTASVNLNKNDSQSEEKVDESLRCFFPRYPSMNMKKSK